MRTDLIKTAQHWNEQGAHVDAGTGGFTWWEAGPEVQRHVNKRITGDPNLGWVNYTLTNHFQPNLGSILVLGCGTGELERSLASLVSFEHCDAYDIAQRSVARAREEAGARGLYNIEYHVEDVNRITLPPRAYDAVWVHMALHHFHALEHICREIGCALNRGGRLVLQEYVGPNRFQFPERQKELANACLRLLPSRYRRVPAAAVEQRTQSSSTRGMRWLASRMADKAVEGDLIPALRRQLSAQWSRLTGRPLEKTRVVFPTPSSVVSVDPSEAIRSAEIVQIVEQHFDVVERKDWGGNILQFLLKDIAGNFASGGDEGQAFLKMLISIEETLLDSGEFDSDFAYIVASPRH